MQTYSIRKGTRNLSQHVERAAGFMQGQAMIPDDFERMGAAEIPQAFEGDASCSLDEGK